NQKLRWAALTAAIRLGPAARAAAPDLLAPLAAHGLGKEDGDGGDGMGARVGIGAGPEGIPLLIPGLRSDKGGGGEIPASCLERLGKAAAPSLRGVLESGSPVAAERARRVLRHTQLQKKW